MKPTLTIREPLVITMEQLITTMEPLFSQIHLLLSQARKTLVDLITIAKQPKNVVNLGAADTECVLNPLKVTKITTDI